MVYSIQEVELAPRIYLVRFEANTSRAKIEDYTLLRSAELALESGTRHFIVGRVQNESTSTTVTSPGTYVPGQTICSGHGKDKECTTLPGTWTGGGTYTQTLPGYSYTIYLVDEAEVEGVIVYDARSIQRDLRQKYELEPGSLGTDVSPPEGWE